MLKIGFRPPYRVLHLTNEFANGGGVHAHIAEQYRYRDRGTGFIEYRDDLDFDAACYSDCEDLVIITRDDRGKLETLDFQIIAVHFYRLIEFVTPQLLEQRKLVYIVHSVPTPEPVPKAHAFGGHYDIEQSVKALCHHAAAVVCVSRADATRLRKIWPEYAGKTAVIHNGITLPPGQMSHVSRQRADAA